MIVKLNESVLFAMGFDRASVEALRHFLRQVGSAVGGTTLPEAVATQEHLQIEDVFSNSISTRQDIWLDVDQKTLPDHGAAIAELTKQVAQLRSQMADWLDMSASVSELKKSARGIEIAYSLPPVAMGIDWTRPGRIGSSTPNTGSFTTLSASGAVTLSPASANVALSPTGTGLVTIDPATAGTMNNMAIGGTTPRAGAFTTISASGQITSTVATGTPPFVVASFTNVPGLNASLLLGFNWVTPGTIGSTTPNTGRFTSVTVPGGAQFITTNTALTDGAGASAGTITNAPAAGNPTKWIGINDNGTIRKIPAW